MEHLKRRAISYIVGRILSGKESGAVFDFKDSKYYNFSGEIGNTISVFDYSRSSYLTGDKTSIFDDYSKKYISLVIEGIVFSGFDYESGEHFSGNVNSNSISFYDYDGSTYYNFSI